MPTESKAFSVPLPTVNRVYNTSSLPYPGIVTRTLPIGISGTRGRSWAQTPGYALKVGTGKLPENAYSFSLNETIFRAGLSRTITIQANGHRSTVETIGVQGHLGINAPFLLDTSAFMRSEVIARLQDKILDSDFDAAVFAGEFKETCRMFQGFSDTLVKAVKALRRGDLPSLRKLFPGSAGALGDAAKKGSRDFANGWLLYNYGIAPLVSDLQGSLKALEKGMIKEQYRVVSTRLVHYDKAVSTTGSLTSSAGVTVTSWDRKLEVSGRLKYTVDNSKIATLSSLGLSNPLVLAWELTRLSFVLDWAVDVGSWLGQVNVYFGKTFHSGSITTFKKDEGFWDHETMYVTSTSIKEVRESGKQLFVTVGRVPLTTFPVNWIPAIKDPVSLSHVITSLSLARQSLRK